MPAVQVDSLGTIFVNALRGQELRIPDLVPFFSKWPAAVLNDNYDELVIFVEQLIESMDPPERQAKHKDQDLPLFIAYWYPNADWETLKTLAMYVTWLFLWDDAVDTGEYDLADNLVRANKFRSDTLYLYEKYFGDGTLELPADIEVCNINAVIEPLAHRLKEFFNPAQMKTFHSRVKDYVNSCELEQVWRMEGHVPGYEEYIKLRLDTTAVYSLCALSEYDIGESIPAEWHGRDGITSLVWDEANMLVILLNDPLSLKKELKTGCVINVLTALMDKDTDVQRAMNTSIEMLAKSINAFDTGVAEFAETLKDDSVLLDRLQRYCDSCRRMATGTLYFTLKSNRYRIQDRLNKDGSLTIPL